MTDTLMLKSAIVRNGMTIAQVAKSLGLSVYGFHKKLHNVTEFKASEIESLCKLLDIGDKESYFFASKSE